MNKKRTTKMNNRFQIGRRSIFHFYFKLDGHFKFATKSRYALKTLDGLDFVAVAGADLAMFCFER